MFLSNLLLNPAVPDSLLPEWSWSSATSMRRAPMVNPCLEWRFFDEHNRTPEGDDGMDGMPDGKCFVRSHPRCGDDCEERLIRVRGLGDHRVGICGWRIRRRLAHLALRWRYRRRPSRVAFAKWRIATIH